jgi:hypothetical protein
MPKRDAAAFLAGLSSPDDLERSEARRSILEVRADTDIDVDVLIGGLESDDPCTWDTSPPAPATVCERWLNAIACGLKNKPLAKKNLIYRDRTG